MAALGRADQIGMTVQQWSQEVVLLLWDMLEFAPHKTYK